MLHTIILERGDIMFMCDNYSCCQTPYYGYETSGCGCQNRGSIVYVILVLFVLCAFTKRSCLEFDRC